MSNVIRPDT
ncbi:hypothetical protein D038_1653A, partial [Vibrio parahaemolyticus IDH02189]